jgi:DNA (cytosine-5)-methyltransferase 1
VSILGEQSFRFPNPIPLEKRLKDVLEDKVAEKYYLSEKAVEGFMKHNENHEAKGTGFI